jgi:hypothetical protein
MAAADLPLHLDVHGSTAVRTVSYDPERRVLDIRYAEGDRYSYVDVPVETYRALLQVHRQGGSLGRFVNARIKPHHPHRLDVARRRFRPRADD